MTGLYTVLVEGDEMSDPIADSVRAILDGHIVLTRELASKGHFPAIDILQSVSRVMPDIVTPEHMESARFLKELLAVYGEAEDLINLGAYRMGANPRIDLAVEFIEPIRAFLRQQMNEPGDLAKSLQGLKEMVEEAQTRQRPMKEPVA